MGRRRRRPLRALPYFSPSCQGTTGLLANLVSLLMGGLCLPASSTTAAAGARGPYPAVFPGNPSLWGLQGGPQALELGDNHPPPRPAPGGHLPPPPAPRSGFPWPGALGGTVPFLFLPSQPFQAPVGPGGGGGSTTFSTCSRAGLGVTWALPSRPLPLPTPSHLPESPQGQPGTSCVPGSVPSVVSKRISFIPYTCPSVRASPPPHFTRGETEAHSVNSLISPPCGGEGPQPRIQGRASRSGWFSPREPRGSDPGSTPHLAPTCGLLDLSLLSGPPDGAEAGASPESAFSAFGAFSLARPCAGQGLGKQDGRTQDGDCRRAAGASRRKCL